MSNGNSGMAAAVFFPGGVFITKKEEEKTIDTNHFHVSLAHAHLSVLKAIARQHGIQQVGSWLRVLDPQ